MNIQKRCSIKSEKPEEPELQNKNGEIKKN